MKRNLRMKKQRHLVIVWALLFSLFILGAVVAMNIKNSINLHSILTESVKGQLISTSLAAREMLDIDAFVAYQDESVALFFIDLDNFKQVNDGAGHDAGDELLRQIGRFLDTTLDNARAFRPSAGKLNIAARVGGDEFIQVVQGLDSAEKAAEAAEQLLEHFKAANLSRHVEKYNVGLSIGVARYPYDTKDYHVLIRYADVAMYHAKRSGKNHYRLYSDEMTQET